MRAPLPVIIHGRCGRYAVTRTPFRTLAEAEEAQRSLIVGGGWPRGKRRNADTKPPRGYKTLEAFFAAVRDACRVRRGRLTELAEFMGANPKLVGHWLAGRKVPQQRRITHMATWLKRVGR